MIKLFETVIQLPVRHHERLFVLANWLQQHTGYLMTASNKHPGTLLHGMLHDLGLQQAVGPTQVDANSPLASWDALLLIRALYR